MDDYISREAAEERLNRLEREAYHNSVLWPDHVEECREAIRDIPAADVQPVVYCRDCIHLGFKDFNGICNGPMCGIVKPWDYCSHGLRGG